MQEIAIPSPDISNLLENLERCKSNIFKSFPNSRWGSNRDAFCYRRVKTHLDSFTVRYSVVLNSHIWKVYVKIVEEQEIFSICSNKSTTVLLFYQGIFCFLVVFFFFKWPKIPGRHCDFCFLSFCLKKKSQNKTLSLSWMRIFVSQNIKTWIFQKSCIDQGKQLESFESWTALLDYILKAWEIVDELPQWDNPDHNKTKNRCFKTLGVQCKKSISHSHLTQSEYRDMLSRLVSKTGENWWTILLVMILCSEDNTNQYF